MKTKRYLYNLLGLAVVVQLTSCSKEDKLTPTADVGVMELFQPAPDANPLEKSMYQEYGVWARLDYKDSREVYNSYLGQDATSARFPAEKVDDDLRESTYVFLNTLLSNVNKEFSKKLMPNEVFFVKTYGHPYFIQKFTTIGRNRLVVTWPNAISKMPIENPETLYYTDEALAKGMWDKLSELVSARLTEEIEGFEELGKPYDGGTAFGKIRDQYFVDRDLQKRNRDWKALADEGGFLDQYSTFSFRAEYKAWLKLILTESFENIDSMYLESNSMRKAKYELFVDHFKKEYNWDIQAVGDKYREKSDSFKD